MTTNSTPWKGRSLSALRTTFLVLTATRWAGVGFVISLLTLWMVERGLTLTQVMTAAAFTGIVVFVFELPTSGLADAFGRRRIYLVAGCFDVAASLVFLYASTWWHFLAAAFLSGVFRALDSGPLESWFIDAAHEIDSNADISRSLAHAGTVVGLSIAAGSLLSGALVWWHPFSSESPLWLPFLVWSACTVMNVAAVFFLMQEPSRAKGPMLSALRQGCALVPGIMASSIKLVRTRRVLAMLLVAEALLAASIVVLENFQPLRLAELAGGSQAAGALMGPTTAIAWGGFALGSAVAAALSSRLGTVWAAVVGRAATVCGLLAMAIVVHPVALIVAYLFTYSVGGLASPMHEALVHREASSSNRTTVASLNSMVFFCSFAVVGVAMGAVAEQVSTSAAMFVAVPLAAASLFCYLPARTNSK